MGKKRSAAIGKRYSIFISPLNLYAEEMCALVGTLSVQIDELVTILKYCVQSEEPGAPSIRARPPFALFIGEKHRIMKETQSPLGISRPNPKSHFLHPSSVAAVYNYIPEVPSSTL